MDNENWLDTTAEEEWVGCYKPHKWDNLRAKESIKHPAKMANGLLQRIFQHLMANDILKIGDTVLDPMGGIGTTAIGWCAMHPDNKAITVELEDKFIEFQKANKRKAEEILNRKVNWAIIKGDARELSKILEEKGLIGVTSPPYSDTTLTSSSNFHSRHQKKRPKAKDNPQEGYSPDPNNIGNLKDKPITILSPPHGMGKGIGHSGDDAKDKIMKEKQIYARYGDHRDQIGNLPDKPVAVISPPYGNITLPMSFSSKIRKLARDGKMDEAIAAVKKIEQKSVDAGGKYAVTTDETIKKHILQALEREKGNYSVDDNNIANLKDKPITILSPPYANRFDKGNEQQRKREGTIQNEMDVGGYSDDPTNIGNLKDRKPVAVSSPPYPTDMHNRMTDKCRETFKGRSYKPQQEYGRTEGQIGDLKDKGKTYLDAMLQVYHECSKVCRCIVTVTKNPTRKKKLRRLDLDTKKLLEAVGFDPIIWIKARLFDIITKTDLKGNVTRTVKGRMSFFKRLQFEKGNPCAQHEDILIGMKGGME